jgi:hypothetical protein
MKRDKTKWHWLGCRCISGNGWWGQWRGLVGCRKWGGSVDWGTCLVMCVGVGGKSMGNILWNKSSDWHLREIAKFSNIFQTMVLLWWHLRLLSFHWQLSFADNLVWFQFQRQLIFVTTEDEFAPCIRSWFMWKCITYRSSTVAPVHDSPLKSSATQWRVCYCVTSAVYFKFTHNIHFILNYIP